MDFSEPKAGEQVRDVRVMENTLSVDLLDGRTITVPLVWFPRLLRATPQQRRVWEIAGAGYGIHWPEIDEDISVQGLLVGAPASRVKVAIESQVAAVQLWRSSRWTPGESAGHDTC